MIPFLDQLKLIFMPQGGSGARVPQPSKRFFPKGSKQRDPQLEQQVRSALSLIAPELGCKVVAGWNSRMRTTAGVAIAARWEIWLNPALREISSEEVERTLLHELAHLLASHRHGRRRLAPHGAEWRLACRDLGIPDEGRTHQLPFTVRSMRRRFRLRCPGCGEIHDRVRRPRGRVACLRCCRIHSGGKYDERYRLIIASLDEAS